MLRRRAFAEIHFRYALDLRRAAPICKDRLLRAYRLPDAACDLGEARGMGGHYGRHIVFRAVLFRLGTDGPACEKKNSDCAAVIHKEKPRRFPGGALGCCAKKGIRSIFLQGSVLLVQLLFTLEVGLDASVARADLLVGVHMRHLVHVVLLDSLEQVRTDECGVLPLDGDVAVEQAAVIRSLLFIGKLKDSPTMRALIHEKSFLRRPDSPCLFSCLLYTSPSPRDS